MANVLKPEKQATVIGVLAEGTSIRSIGWNARKVTDGERTVSALKAGEGKRLMYKAPVASI